LEIEECVSGEEDGQSGGDEVRTKHLKGIPQTGPLVGEGGHDVGETEEERREAEREDREGEC
jgi:hypothetical protein